MGGNAEKACVGKPPHADGAERSLPLPQEMVPLLLELLDVQSLVRLRRASRLGGFHREVHLAELRGVVLEMLAQTRFPFTHAAYVLGLNGQYYSYDTVAENHYGIPKLLPHMICRLFKVAVPGAAFTTIRIQKLAAAANFGGKHRTLAFSLACPSQEQPEDGTDSSQEEPLCEAQGHLLCLTAGCTGGRGEFCEDVGDGQWRVLAKPSVHARWIPFARRAWLQWHWPQRGDMYTIIVTCEPSLHRGRLSRRDRKQMTEIGFLLPEYACGGKEAEAAESSASGDDDKGVEAAAPTQGQQKSAPVRRSAAALQAARRVLQLEGDAPSPAEIEEAFRRMVRVVHPDLDSQRTGSEAAARLAEPAGVRGITQGWAMSQLTWARKVLREAAHAGASVVQDGRANGLPQQTETLMLTAPVLEDGVGL